MGAEAVTTSFRKAGERQADSDHVFAIGCIAKLSQITHPGPLQGFVRLIQHSPKLRTQSGRCIPMIRSARNPASKSSPWPTTPATASRTANPSAHPTRRQIYHPRVEHPHERHKILPVIKPGDDQPNDTGPITTVFNCKPNPPPECQRRGQQTRRSDRRRAGQAVDHALYLSARLFFHREKQHLQPGILNGEKDDLTDKLTGIPPSPRQQTA